MLLNAFTFWSLMPHIYTRSLQFHKINQLHFIHSHSQTHTYTHTHTHTHTTTHTHTSAGDVHSEVRWRMGSPAPRTEARNRCRSAQPPASRASTEPAMAVWRCCTEPAMPVWCCSGIACAQPPASLAALHVEDERAVAVTVGCCCCCCPHIMACMPMRRTSALRSAACNIAEC